MWETSRIPRVGAPGNPAFRHGRRPGLRGRGCTEGRKWPGRELRGRRPWRIRQWCLAPSAPMLLAHKLPAGLELQRQGVLTAGEGRKAAYLTLARVVFVLRRSAMICAPSALRPLKPKLQTRVEWTRQGVLTVGKRCAAAYLRVCRVELVFSASEMCIAPSAPMALSNKLPEPTGDVRGC